MSSAELLKALDDLAQTLGSVEQSNARPEVKRVAATYGGLIRVYRPIVEAGKGVVRVRPTVQNRLARIRVYESAQSWEQVIRHSYRLLSALPGDPSIEPKRPPRPPRKYKK